MRLPARTLFPRRWPLLGLTALLLLATALAIALAVTNPAGAQDNQLQVSVKASPSNPEVDDPVVFSASISNAPSGAGPSYRWELDLGSEWMNVGEDSTFSFSMASPGSTTVRVKVSYDSGASATSEPLTVHWAEPDGYTPIPDGKPTPTPSPEPTPEPTPDPDEEPTPTPTPEPTPTPTPQPVPAKPAALRVATEQGSKDVSVDWDAVDHADYYLVRWRAVKGKLNAGVETKSTSLVVTVADYGQWVVRLEACNDSGCGKPATRKFRVKPPPPAVTAVQVTSQPLYDGTYTLNEDIRISVTFDRPVAVTGTPRLKIDMDPANWGEKWANYQEGSGTTTLTFAHTVVEPNYSTQGISVVGDSLELNGGTINSVEDVSAAELGHASLDHDSSHKVDWQKMACELVAPTALEGMGFENGAAVNWQMPDEDSTDNACEGSGFVLEARGSPGTFVFTADGFHRRSLLARDIPAGAYDMSIYANYRGRKSMPFNLGDLNVPDDCSVTLTLESPAQYQVAGTWTNASQEYGCEAGGVYIDWKKTTDSEWMSSARQENEDEIFNETGFIFGNMDAEEYQFRIRTVDVRGLGKTEIRRAWVRTSPIATITPAGMFPGRVEVTTSDLVPAEYAGDTVTSLRRIGSMRVFLDWKTPVGYEDIETYRIRYRDLTSALEDGPVIEFDITAGEFIGSSENPNQRPGYILEGLDKRKRYVVQVGIKLEEDGKTVVHWSDTTRVDFEPHRFRMWWDNNTPRYVASVGRIFLRVAANDEKASAIAFVNGGAIQAPPGSSISLDTYPPATYSITAIGTLGAKDDTGQIYAAIEQPMEVNLPDASSATRSPLSRNYGIEGPEPAGPADLVTRFINPGKAKFTWSAPSGISSLQGYKVRHRPRGSDAWTTSALLAATVEEFELSGLMTGTVYETQVGVCVRACNLDHHYLWSETREVPDPQDFQPGNLAFGAHYGLGITAVSWEPPAINAGAVTGYVVEWEEAATGEVKQSSLLDDTAESFDIPHLPAGWVRVAARTDQGDTYTGVFNAPVDPLHVWFDDDEEFPTPLVVNNLVFMWVATNKNAAVVCFINAGTSPNDTVNCPPETTVSLPEPTSPFPAWAEATSVADPSEKARVETHEVVATGPRSPRAGASGGNGTLRVGWNEVRRTSSRQVGAINGYIVQLRGWKEDAGVWKWEDTWTETVKAATDRYHTFTGLDEGTYQVRVRGRTDANDEDESTHIAGTTSTVRTVVVAAANTNTPGSPGGSVVADTEALTVTWQRPDPDSGSLVHGYTVRHKVSGAADSSYVETKLYPGHPVLASGDVKLTGLTTGTAYVVQIRSHNANGDSSWVTIGTTHTPN